MANLDFFATRADMIDLLRFLYTETDCVVFESYSAYDAELRRFSSVELLDAAYPIGSDPHGHGYAIPLQLWSPSVARPPHIKRISLSLPGHSFRYCVESAGLIQLYLGGICGDYISQSHFGHWNEAGAKQRCILPATDVDWPSLRSLSARIQRHIKRHLATAKYQARYVLTHAYNALRHGKIGRDGAVEFGIGHPGFAELRNTNVA